MLPEDLGPYVALMLAGFACGILGHILRLRWMVALGIVMIFTATLLVPVALNLFSDRPEPPGPNVPPALLGAIAGACFEARSAVRMGPWGASTTST